MTRTRHHLLALVGAAAAGVTGLVVAAPAHAATATLTAPATAAAGSQALFGGANWTPYDSVNLFLVRAGVSTFTCTLHADDTGALVPQTCPIPTQLTTGAFTAHADDSHGLTADAAGALTLTPALTTTSTFSSQPTAEVAAGSTLNLTGHGFSGSSAFTVKLGTTTLATVPASPVTDGNGTFTNVTVTIPAGQAAGAATITVKDAVNKSATTGLVVYRATATGSASGVAGTPYVVGGAGWPGVDSVNVYLQKGAANTFFCTVRSNDAGTIPATSCTLPANLPQGAYTLLLTDTMVTAGAAITLGPSLATTSTFNSQPTGTVASGSTVSLTGHGYAPNSALTIKLGANALASTVTSTDANGTFTNAIVTIPAGQAAAKVTLGATDAAGNTKTAKLTDYRAKNIAPAAAKAGSTQLFGGTGWPVGATVNAYVHAASGANTFFCTLHSDTTGTIPTQSCAVPTSLPAGAYSVLLTDGFVTATSAFTMQSSIAVTNNSGQPMAGGAVGDTVHVNGFGFTASSTITVKLGTKVITTVPASIASNSNGTFFGATFAVPNVAAGTYVLSATDEAGKKGAVQFTVS